MEKLSLVIFLRELFLFGGPSGISLPFRWDVFDVSGEFELVGKWRKTIVYLHNTGFLFQGFSLGKTELVGESIWDTWWIPCKILQVGLCNLVTSSNSPLKRFGRSILLQPNNKKARVKGENCNAITMMHSKPAKLSTWADDFITAE
jgi:hypothetical protein